MRIHRNLHNAKAGGPQWVETKGGKVQQYLEAIGLVDVTTRIQPAGQRKCAESQVRSVCAYFDGNPGTDWETIDPRRDEGWLRVSYDPRKDTAFMAGGKPWNTAVATLLLADGSTWVLLPTFEEK